MANRANISQINVGECLYCARTDKDYGITINESYIVVKIDDKYIYVDNNIGLIVGVKRFTGYFLETEIQPEVLIF